MKKTALSLSLACALALVPALSFAAVFSSDLPPDYESWPVIDVRPATYELHAEPSSASPVVTTVKVAQERSVTCNETRAVTLTAGSIKTMKPQSFKGPDFGAIDHLTLAAYRKPASVKDWTLRPGQVFDFLRETYDGQCLIRIGPDVTELDSCGWLFDEKNTDYKPLSPARQEWWANVQVGKTTGWVLVDGENVRWKVEQ